MCLTIPMFSKFWSIMLKLIHQKAQAKFPNRKDLKIYIIIHVYILTAYAECVNQPSMRHCSLLNILKKPKTIFTICQYSDQDSRPIATQTSRAYSPWSLSNTDQYFREKQMFRHMLTTHQRRKVATQRSKHTQKRWNNTQWAAINAAQLVSEAPLPCYITTHRTHLHTHRCAPTPMSRYNTHTLPHATWRHRNTLRLT